MKKLRNIVGPQVRRLRYERGLSQSELVARFQVKGWDITRDVLAGIELGRRWVADFEVVFLARHLGVPVDALWPEKIRKALRR
jgi:transcriptional regulator with XRE-family HTH domain